MLDRVREDELGDNDSDIRLLPLHQAAGRFPGRGKSKVNASTIRR